MLHNHFNRDLRHRPDCVRHIDGRCNGLQIDRIEIGRGLIALRREQRETFARRNGELPVVDRRSGACRRRVFHGERPHPVGVFSEKTAQIALGNRRWNGIGIGEGRFGDTQRSGIVEERSRIAVVAACAIARRQIEHRAAGRDERDLEIAAGIAADIDQGRDFYDGVSKAHHIER